MMTAYIEEDVSETSTLLSSSTDSKDLVKTPVNTDTEDIGHEKEPALTEKTISEWCVLT